MVIVIIDLRKNPPPPPSSHVAQYNDWIDYVQVPLHPSTHFNPMFFMNWKDEDVDVFSGEFEDWPEWSFNFPYFSDDKNIKLFRKSPSELPRRKVYRYLWDRAHYRTALRELKRIYGNPSLIMESQLAKIRQYPHLREY